MTLSRACHSCDCAGRMSKVPRGAVMCFTVFQTGGAPSNVVLAMPLSFRRHALTYLRAAATCRPRLAHAVLVTLALAAVLPPAIAVPLIAPAAASALRAWQYFCSMLLGSAPFL